MSEKGFIMTAGKYLYFLPSEKEKKCKSVIDKFIVALCKRKGIEVQDKYFTDDGLHKDILYRTSKGSHKLVTTENGFQYHNFKTKNSSMNFPINDCEEVIFLD